MFLNKTMSRIYHDNRTELNNERTTEEHWMSAGIEIPIIAMKYNIVCGFYDPAAGTTCIASPVNQTNINVEFCHDFLPPALPNSMLVYNGNGHFEYLFEGNTSPQSSHIVESKDNHEKTTTALLPSDEAFYNNFTPDYTACELMICAVGYDID